MKELTEYIANSLVDIPEKVEVREFKHGSHISLELRVAKEDMGRIIGKQGRTAQAMRTILSAASGKTKKRITLEIIE